MNKTVMAATLFALCILIAPEHRFASSPSPRQTTDSAFNATVARPAYPRLHPRVLFDEAHDNADTSGGSYKAFVDLVKSDGYHVLANSRKISVPLLTGYSVLVIVNASGPQAKRNAPAFTAAECDAVRDWVKSGGALLLISDHSPFSTAVSPLSQSFNVELTNGFTIDPIQHNKESEDETELVFTRENALLMDHPITRGRNPSERINRIMTFSGTSLKGPEGSVAFLKLADTAFDVLPPDRKQASPEDAPPDYKKVSAAGRAQGLALGFGKGRLVVLGEAAMLTAQVARKGFPFGMNLPNIDNRQLALNIMHWLSRLLK